MLYLLVFIAEFFHYFSYFMASALEREVFINNCHNSIAGIYEFIPICHSFDDFFDSVELLLSDLLVADQVLYVFGLLLGFGYERIDSTLRNPILFGHDFDFLVLYQDLMRDRTFLFER